MTEVPRPVLKDTKALVIGIANEHSIAYGCARAFRELGAELAVTYLNEKAKPYVQPLADELQASMFMPLDVARPGKLESVFAQIERQWSHLDILVHSIAFAPKEDLQGSCWTALPMASPSPGHLVPSLHSHGAPRQHPS